MAGEGRNDTNGVAVLPRIHEALQLIHNPYSDNVARQEAQRFLEDVKNTNEAPSHGYTLASDKSQAPVVRHYALSLLEHAIKHKWEQYTKEQAVALRNWVLELSRNVSREDPGYLRNKVAVLWVEVAKRSWVADWMDMDTLLVQLWQVPDSAVHKELVLLILETLSDEIFNGDDAVVAVREGVLSKASVEIFTPAAVLLETFPKRQPGPEVRCGDEGWLRRITDFLGQCLAGDLQNEEIRNCAVRGLTVIHSLMPWVIPNAATATGCVPVVCDALRAPHVAVQKAALESLHALYSRTSFIEQEFLDLVVPLYDRKYIQLFRHLFEWSTVDAEDIDDDKYQCGKKLSELVSFLGNYMDRRFAALPNDPERVDFQGFLQLLLLVTQSQSLIVSIPVLVTWSRLLGHKSIGPSIAALPAFIGPLLEVCGSRQFRYDSLPEDTQDPTFLFLLEDTDTIPERHAFLGNYRRYSSQVIENIVRLQVVDAIQHILGQTENILEHLYDGQPRFDPANYTKSSAPVLRVDAQATLIEAALKGITKWRGAETENAQHEQEIISLENSLQSWANRLLVMKFEDPLIRKRILQLLVAFSTTALDKNAGFMLKVLEHILVTWPAAQPQHKTYSEAIKDLQAESMVELQRLASKMPDHLLDVYDQIAGQVNEMIASGTLDEKRQVAYQTFLFTIVHRSSRLDKATKVQKLEEFIVPIRTQWQDNSLKSALSSYSGFCEMMALNKAQDYLARRRVHEIRDWGSVQLDDEGKALQSEMEQRQAALPLRPTKSFLTCSVENIDKNTTPYQTSCELWQDGFPVILPELLKFLSHAHASHTPDNWVGLPAEMRTIVGRVLTDRFWQAGISEGSKDDFYARVVDKKHTVEGLASTIRGTIRFVRESCYAIIYCMSRLDMQFYGFSELPGPLAHSLLADSHYLSAHQLINLLNLVRYLVDNCPIQLRDHFLPPLLAACFQQMDDKVNSEWQKLDQQQGVQAGGDALTEEMKAESILRQLTYTAVMIVADFLDPARSEPPFTSSEQHDRNHPSLRKFCLMQSAIVEPLLMFCTHAIRMRDTRCCSIMLRVFRSIVPDFQTAGPISLTIESKSETEKKSIVDVTPIPASTASVIREYISSDVLKACITSLHEPYFVDLQKDLAVLIATILLHFCPLTQTPRDVLLSLPNIQQGEVDKAIESISKPGLSSRSQRAIVLDLLRDLKGVSISEMGKLQKSFGDAGSKRVKKSARSKMAQEFMKAPTPSTTSTNAPQIKTEDGLEGVASLFNE
ncbi:armadillo-type protein [Pseudomassariella vexata]|uniref:Armadillo-type protein n=1 Tax=Pseudomassariella vexata TaxID=1141098 RepID=A0A1Y2E896_9PEZI|nr:armadillo-type protein [Pseudomassariella vexata]ORY67085.1 armadillo-type protein [Pseudomassariella vexata]